MYFNKIKPNIAPTVIPIEREVPTIFAK